MSKVTTLAYIVYFNKYPNFFYNVVSSQPQYRKKKWNINITVHHKVSR